MASGDLITTVVGLSGTGILAGIGFVIRSAQKGIQDRLDDIETGMSRATGQILADFREVRTQTQSIERRVTRLESWRELMSLPHDMRDRRKEGDDHG